MCHSTAIYCGSTMWTEWWSERRLCTVPRRRRLSRQQLLSSTTTSLYHRRTWGQYSRNTPSTNPSRVCVGRCTTPLVPPPWRLLFCILSSGRYICRQHVCDYLSVILTDVYAILPRFLLINLLTGTVLTTGIYRANQWSGSGSVQPL